MINRYKVNEIADKLNISQATVYRKMKKLRKQLKAHSIREGKTLFITEEGIKILNDSLDISKPIENKELSPENQDDKVEKIENQLILTLKNQLEKIEKKLDEKEEYIKHFHELQHDNQMRMAEERQRTDTIIMSLTKRLEDIQKRLPELPAPKAEPEEKKGLIKRFISWVTAPDPQPTNWDDSEIFSKAN